MRQMIVILLAMGFVAGSIWGTPAAAGDAMEVLKVETLVMEKGTDNISLTVKVFVKNNGEPADVAINVTAVDSEGFELETATVSGSLKAGQTKVLVGVVKIPVSVYSKIVKWKWKK